MRAGMFQSLFFELPRVRRLMNTMADGPRKQCSLIVLTKPQDDRDEIMEHLEICLEKSADIERLDLTTLDCDQPIPFILGNLYGVQWSSSTGPFMMNSLAHLIGLPSILFLEGFERLKIDHRSKWLDFLEQWAQHTHTALDAGERSTAFILVVPNASMTKLPKTSIALSLNWWWGLPSVLETRQLCRLLQDIGIEDNYLQLLWKENVLPAIVGDDLPLAEYLWDHSSSEMEALESGLLAYAEHMGWDRLLLQIKGVTESLAATLKKERSDLSCPPQLWRALWSEGLISWTAEYGAEIHIAAAAVLGWKEELQHRIWRGQAQLLLPMVDSLRLALCDRLARDYGKDWPFKYQEPADAEQKEKVRQSPLACEWGHMQYLLNTCHYFKNSRQFIPTVRLAREIRNDLAHYQPIGFSAYSQFCREYQSKVRNVL